MTTITKTYTNEEVMMMNRKDRRRLAKANGVPMLKGKMKSYIKPMSTETTNESNR